MADQVSNNRSQYLLADQPEQTNEHDFLQD